MSAWHAVGLTLLVLLVVGVAVQVAADHDAGRYLLGFLLMPVLVVGSGVVVLGHVEPGDPSRVTELGLAALGPYEPLPAGRALAEWWQRHGGLGKAEREILGVLVDHAPARLTPEQVAAYTPSGYEPRGGGYRNAMGRLRTLGLIVGRGGVAAAPELFEES